MAKKLGGISRGLDADPIPLLCTCILSLSPPVTAQPLFHLILSHTSFLSPYTQPGGLWSPAARFWCTFDDYILAYGRPLLCAKSPAKKLTITKVGGDRIDLVSSLKAPSHGPIGWMHLYVQYRLTPRIPRLSTDTSEHIRFYFLVFLSFPILVVGSVW